MCVNNSNIVNIMCIIIREVPTKMPPRISGFAKPPALYGTFLILLIMETKQYQIRTKNGELIDEKQLPKVRKIVRVVSLKRYTEAQSTKSHLTIVTATDANSVPLNAPIFINTKLAEHRAIDLLCLGGAELRKYNSAENPPKLVAIYCIDYDSPELQGCEYWTGEEWRPLGGLNVQFVEELTNDSFTASENFERQFGVKFDISNPDHREMIQKFL